MKVLITGAAGFLGSHLAAHYFHGGHQLRLVSSQARRSADARLSWHRIDLERPNAMASLGELMLDVDLCLFLAARIPFPQPIADVFTRNKTIDSISAAAFAASGCPRAVYLSGMSVFSSTQDQPVDERSIPEPQTDYIRSKLYGEELFLDAGQRAGSRVQVLRVQAPYGPGAPPDSVIQVFVRNCLAGRPLQVHGDGSRCQHFTWVGDICRAVDLLESQPDGIHHFCGPSRVDMRQLAEICLAEINPDSRIVLLGGDPGVSCADFGPDRFEGLWPRARRTSLPKGLKELARHLLDHSTPLAELCP